MCVKLSQTGKIIMPGQIAVIKTKQGEKTSKWGYASTDIFVGTNARFETVKEKWLSRGYQTGSMEVDSFYEGTGKLTKEFKFPRPDQIGIIYSRDHFLVVTEPAGPQVAKVHHRQPCIRNLKQLLAA